MKIPLNSTIAGSYPAPVTKRYKISRIRVWRNSLVIKKALY